MNTRKYSPIAASPNRFFPADGATMKSKWNRIQPRSACPLVAFFNGCTTYQNGCTCVQTHLLMGTVSLEGTHVLNEDQLSPASQYGRDHDSDHANAVHIDTGSIATVRFCPTARNCWPIFVFIRALLKIHNSPTTKKVTIGTVTIGEYILYKWKLCYYDSSHADASISKCLFSSPFSSLQTGPGCPLQ